MSACSEHNKIQTYRVVKDVQVLKLSVSSLSDNKHHLNWDAPINWIASDGSSMRLASYQIPHPNGNGDLSVIELGGNAGGMVLNVNRWRKQLGLTPMTEYEINSIIKTEQGILGEYQWFHLQNENTPETAFLAAIITLSESTLFIKLSASSQSIQNMESDFLNFCTSIRTHP